MVRILASDTRSVSRYRVSRKCQNPLDRSRPTGWVKAPRVLSTFSALSPRDEQVWNRINAAWQINNGNASISVSELAKYCGCSARTVARSLARLKQGGWLYSLSEKGCKAAYYPNVAYVQKRITPTPDKSGRSPNKEVKALEKQVPAHRHRASYTPYRRDDSTPVLSWDKGESFEQYARLHPDATFDEWRPT